MKIIRLIIYIGCLAAVFSTGISCRKEKNPQSFLPENNIEEFVAEKLDLTTFPNSLELRRKPGMRFFSDFGFKPTETRKGKVCFETQDWYYNIIILDRQDYNEDGLEDLIIRFEDDGKHATYCQADNYIITRYSNTGNLIALSFEPILTRIKNNAADKNNAQ
ncbi:hypothetical protein ACFLS1_07725 [Verrucomicrobiota bacterium]